MNPADHVNPVKVAAGVDAVTPDLLAFAQELVRIPSLPGDERAAHEAAGKAMRRLGLNVSVVSPTRPDVADHPAFCDDGLPIEGRVSLVGRWRAGTPRSGARSLILNGHLDVVSPGDPSRWTESPWSGRIDGGRLYGRGACDMKAGVACAIFAIAALQRIGFEPGADVLVETVSGEESGGLGTLATIVAGHRADAAVILEPTSLRVCPVQAGALTFRLVVRGRAAHGALKHSGVSAVEKLCLLLDALDRLDRERHARRSHPLFSNPRQIAPVSVGVVRAGDWPSTVPDAAIAEGRFGVFPGESVDEARRALESAVRAAADGDPWLRAEPPAVEWFEGQFEAGETPADAPIVQALSEAHRSVHGVAPVVEGVPYGSDLRLFTNHAGIPCVLYGPGDVARAHTVGEWVAVDEVIAATRAIAALVAGWTGSPEVISRSTSVP
ncbi:MAG: ArgE/DapE family deacylase [Betaproteobacteria bacterium]